MSHFALLNSYLGSVLMSTFAKRFSEFISWNKTYCATNLSIVSELAIVICPPERTPVYPQRSAGSHPKLLF